MEFRPSYDRPTGTKAPDHDGVSAFRTCEQRPEWAPSIPRDQRCSHEPGVMPGPPLAAFQRHGSYTPAQLPSIRGHCMTGHQSRVQVLRPPGLPLTCSPRMTRAPLGFNPRLRTHASRTHARTPGQGQASSTSLGLHPRHLPHARPPICESTRNCATSRRTHNAVWRYAFALGRENVLPAALGRTGGNNIPKAASLAQSATGLAVIAAYALTGQNPMARLFFWLGTTGGLLGMLRTAKRRRKCSESRRNGNFRRRAKVIGLPHRHVKPRRPWVVWQGMASGVPAMDNTDDQSGAGRGGAGGVRWAGLAAITLHQLVLVPTDT